MGFNIHAELEIQRRHLINETDPKSREMIMCGIDRLLDQMLQPDPLIPLQLEPSAEGQAHLDKPFERGCE